MTAAISVSKHFQGSSLIGYSQEQLMTPNANVPDVVQEAASEYSKCWAVACRDVAIHAVSITLMQEDHRRPRVTHNVGVFFYFNKVTVLTYRVRERWQNGVIR